MTADAEAQQYTMKDLHGTWKPVPGFSGYEASHRGFVRSIDRPVGGRQLRGRVLKSRVAGTSPYPLVNLTDDQGVKQTRTVHSLVLLAHAGECPEGQEALHKHDDPLDNRWPEELSYGTHPENVVQRMRNRPAQPKPVRVCVRCHSSFEGNGKRCHPCVVEIGEIAARRLSAGEDPDQVALALDYPSTVGVWRLAVKYGHARVAIVPDELAALAAESLGERPPLSQRVMTTLRARFGRGDTA